MQTQLQQPLFKPLNSSETSSLFTFDSSIMSKNHNGNQNNNNATFQLARPNEIQAQNTRTSQKQEHNSERLSSLHAKLHQEADKIRKWKIQTEIELKQKEKKIQESTTTIESLRKSILELQLQNENLSLGMKEEIDHREDIMNKINCTRKLCDVLKTRTTQMEEKLNNCETEKTELKYLEKEHQEQFEELNKKFQKLELTSVEDHNRLMNQLNNERDERFKMEKEMETKLSNAEKDLKNLLEQCDEKDVEIREAHFKLQKNEESIHNYQKKIDYFQTEKEMLSKESTEKEEKLQELFDERNTNLVEMNRLEDHITDIEQKLMESKSRIEEIEQDKVVNQTKYDTSIELLQKELEATQLELEQKNLRIKEMEIEMMDSTSMCESLKSSRDVLIMEKTESEARISQLQITLENLQTEKDSVEQNMNGLKTQFDLTSIELAEKSTIYDELKMVNENLQCEIAKQKSSNSNLEDRILALTQQIAANEEEITEKDANDKQLKEKLKKLEHEADNLQKKLSKESGINKELNKNLKGTKSAETAKEKELLTKDKEITNLKKEVEKGNEEMQALLTQLEELKENVSDLRCSLGNVEEENTRLTEENKKLQKDVEKGLVNEKETKGKKIQDLESKQKELKSEITAKNKQIKEIEKELKNTNTKLTAQTKATQQASQQIQDITEEIEALRNANKELQDTNVKESKNTKMHETELSDLKSKMELALKERTEAVAKSEAQISEMSATLQKYRMENQKIVDQKEKEIETLRKQIDESVSIKEKNNEMCENLKKEINQLKGQLASSEKDKHKKAQKGNSNNKKLQEMESQLNAKDKEVKELQEKLTSLENDKSFTSSHSTQTSPAQDKTFKQMSTPLRRTYTPSTPRTQPIARNIYSTPQAILKTPVRANTSPQKSILRGMNSVTKKRKVAFIPDDTGKDDSDSSSSELMEVEPVNIEKFKRGDSTPIFIRPSPRVSSVNAKAQKTPSLTRVPRGPPIKAQPKQSSLSGILSKEKDQFTSLFPSKDNQVSCAKKKQNKSTPKTKHTEKKTKPKFFSMSPKIRQEEAQRSLDKPKDMSWFDLDSVFGFGPED